MLNCKFLQFLHVTDSPKNTNGKKNIRKKGVTANVKGKRLWGVIMNAFIQQH